MEWLIDLGTLAGVFWIDLVLGADLRRAAAGATGALPERDARRAVVAGLVVGLSARLALALIAIQLLQSPWLVMAAGAVLVWSALRAFRDPAPADTAATKPAAVLWRAVLAIAGADLLASWDGLLAIATLGRHSPELAALGMITSFLALTAFSDRLAPLISSRRSRQSAAALVLLIATHALWSGCHALWPALIPATPEALAF